MKINLLLIFTALVSCFSICNAQAKLKGDLKLSAGMAWNDLYAKHFLLGLFNSEGPLYTKNQQGILLADLNLMYIFKAKKWILKPIAGVGYCPFGFIDKGVMYDTSGNLVDYSIGVRMSSGSIFSGVMISLFKKKRLEVKLSQTLQVQFNNVPLDIFRKQALSTRSSLSFDFRFKHRGILSLTPFFQTCLTKFNTRKYDPDGPDYLPYSYGINLGSYFN